MKFKMFGGLYEGEGTPEECALFARYTFPDAISEKLNELKDLTLNSLTKKK